MAIVIIGLANALHKQGRVPGRRGIAGNEAAAAYAKGAAERRIHDRGSHLTAERLSASFIKRRTAERATRRWKEGTAILNQGERTFRLPGPK